MIKKIVFGKSFASCNVKIYGIDLKVPSITTSVNESGNCCKFSELWIH